MNYGQSQAIKVLVGEKMGFPMSSADIARNILEGKPVHVSIGAAIDKEAADLHNKIACDSALVEQANKHVSELLVQYRLA